MGDVGMGNEALSSMGPGRTVVITGASSGIGRASALLMAREGFEVFAGVRREGDGSRLKAEGGTGINPVRIDVTDEASILAAANEVGARLGERGLDGLVNVAGIGTSGPIEFVTQDDLRRIFDVNVFGQVAVIQAFMPMLLEARGRIVNISSVGAHIAIPFGGALTASKGAFGLLSDSLRMELSGFGVRVSVIEPGAIRTPAVDKTLGDVEEVIKGLPPDGARRYGDMLRQFTKRAHARESNGSDPEVVARSVLEALTARRPRARYVVGKDSRVLTVLPRVLPDGVLDWLRMRSLGFGK
jgi:NAD(P)-dependent dehydrogenase (short-subunit alcohol dehydrogenase family)